MRSTKIVATIGPASRDPDVLEQMIRAGVDVARLNFAHGDPEQHAETVAWIRQAAERVGREVAILADVPGPSCASAPSPAAWPSSLAARGRPHLRGAGGHLRAALHRLGGLLRARRPGDICYLADGAVRLRVDEVSNGDVVARVEVGGSVASRQGLNLPNVTVSLPAVIAKRTWR